MLDLTFAVYFIQIWNVRWSV